MTYEIRKAPSGWFWVFKSDGTICRSKRTGAAVAFRSKKGARAYIREVGA